jgi:two-component system phosphate regulon sensor histidine kinase PhoR
MFDAQDALELYRFIIDSLPVAILTVDSELRIRSFNPWAERLTGYTAKEARGALCGDILRGAKCGAHCPLRVILSNETPILGIETTIQNRLGEILPVRMNTAALLNDDGILIGGVESFQDISYLKALEREKDNLISMLAHDMKSSVSIIGGFVLRLLQRADEVDTEKAKKYLGIVKDEAEKLELLINEFLEFSRLRIGKLNLTFDVTSLDKILLEICEAYEPNANSVGIALHLQNDEDLPLIEADARQLRRVFTNLLDNAIKFSGGGKNITVSTRRGEREIQVGIKDEGKGIPPEELPCIFDAFHRSEHGEETKGYGLGLAIVKAIVDAHGGKIEVTSEPAKGSFFEVTLPAKMVKNGL